MDITRENRLIEWLEFKENYKGGATEYFDDGLPESFHKPRKKKTNPEKYQLSRRYVYFNKLKQKADGRCALCKLKKELVIDHCHNTRKIRGVLCQNCNHGLGKFMDNPDLMEEAAKYIRQFDPNKAVDYYTLKGIT